MTQTLGYVSGFRYLIIYGVLPTTQTLGYISGYRYLITDGDYLGHQLWVKSMAIEAIIMWYKSPSTWWNKPFKRS